nr:hypothetical protein [Tanacetum cinerariifolium]
MNGLLIKQLKPRPFDVKIVLLFIEFLRSHLGFSSQCSPLMPGSTRRSYDLILDVVAAAVVEVEEGRKKVHYHVSACKIRMVKCTAFGYSRDKSCELKQDRVVEKTLGKKLLSVVYVGGAFILTQPWRTSDEALCILAWNFLELQPWWIRGDSPMLYLLSQSKKIIRLFYAKSSCRCIFLRHFPTRKQSGKIIGVSDCFWKADELKMQLLQTF